MKSEQELILISLLTNVIVIRHICITYYFWFGISPLPLKSRRDGEGAAIATAKKHALAWQKMTPHVPVGVSGRLHAQMPVMVAL